MPVGILAGRKRLLVIAGLWVAIDVLLIRIAGGVGLRDWAHTYDEMPKLFVGILVVVPANLVAAALVVLRPSRRVLRATVAWAALVAVFGLLLLVRGNDTSGSVIAAAALLVAWLAYRAATATVEVG